MAAPNAGSTLENGVGGLPLVAAQGLNTNKAVNFSGLLVDTSGNLTVPGNLTVQGSSFADSGAQSITSASANALAVGLAGGTNPAFNVDASTASQAAGLNIKGAATGGTVAISAIDSGSNTNISINAKGTGTITIGNVSTGNITLGNAAGSVVVSSAFGVTNATCNITPAPYLAYGTATTAGGALGIFLGNGLEGIYWGSGAPTITAPQGSIYLRTDGSSTSTRLYVNTTGSTTWTNVTTAA